MADKPVTDPADRVPVDIDPPAPSDVEGCEAGASSGPGDVAGSEAIISTDQISDLQRERDDYYDRWLRKTAEFDNYRKRIERERREQADQAIIDLLLELLLVVDDFDRALTVDAGEGGAAYRKGVELIHAKLQDLLGKYRVHPIEVLGADFDPTLHQAVMHEASPSHRENEVIGELRRGYLIGDRLLRPAMVKVAKT